LVDPPRSAAPKQKPKRSAPANKGVVRFHFGGDVHRVHRRGEVDEFVKSLKSRGATNIPHIEVERTGHDGNAFAIPAAVKRAMRRAGLSQAELDAYREVATSGDYNHLLFTTMN
jgi:hypothetical protein